MNLPTPKSAIGRSLERALLLAVAAGLADALAHLSDYNTGKFAGLVPVVYFLGKSLLDFVNSNVPNL